MSSYFSLPIKEIPTKRGRSFELFCVNPRYDPQDPRSPREIRRRFPTLDLALAAYVAITFNGDLPREELGDLARHHLTLDALAAEFLAQSKALPPTLRRYRGIVKNHLGPEFGALPLDQLTPVRIREWIDDVRLQRGRYQEITTSPKTLEVWYGLLCTLCNYAVNQGYLDRSPTRVLRFSRTKRQQAVWTVEQAKTFLRHLREADHLHYHYWYVALATGLRGGEQATLRWRDIVPHPNGGATLHVVQNRTEDELGRPIIGDPKTEAGGRTLEAGPDTVAILRRQWERIEAVKQRHPDTWQEHGLVFPRLDTSRPKELGTMMTGNGLTETLHRLAKKWGLPDITPHAFRHMHGSFLLYELGLPDTVAQARLGHASIKITKDIYAPAPDALLTRAATAMDWLLNDD